MEWDQYFLDICNTVSTQTKCLSRSYGAIIVKDKSIISTGYNGPPKDIPPCSIRHTFDFSFYNMLREKLGDDPRLNEPLKVCPRYLLGAKSGEMIDICPAAHAERNAIANAAKVGVSIKDATMYMNCSVPCFECLKSIINSGIREIVVVNKIFYDKMSEYLLKYSKLNVREYNMGVDI